MATPVLLLLISLNKMEDDEEDMMKLWRMSLELKLDWPKVNCVHHYSNIHNMYLHIYIIDVHTCMLTGRIIIYVTLHKELANLCKLLYQDSQLW